MSNSQSPDTQNTGSQTPSSSELHTGPGFRVQLAYPSNPASLVARLAEFETPEISDKLNRLYALDSGVRCLTKMNQVAGTVCTVSVYPGDNLMVHKALDVARPGDVVMINAHGAAGASNAVIGDMIATKAKHRGIAGFIIDGLLRDLPGIDDVGLPMFARGTTAVGPLHRGPGEINYPISCGGVVVNPGDIVVGDTAGIVVIPRAFANELAGRLEAGAQKAAEYLASVQRGEFSMQWVDDMLAAGGCHMEGMPAMELPEE